MFRQLDLLERLDVGGASADMGGGSVDIGRSAVVEKFTSYAVVDARAMRRVRQYDNLSWERSSAGILVSGENDYLFTIWKRPVNGDKPYKAQVEDKRDGYRVVMREFYPTEDEAIAGIKDYLIKRGRRSLG